ncbi:MAG: TonB-dependent receptor [Agarilytica sp.]
MFFKKNAVLAGILFVSPVISAVVDAQASEPAIASESNSHAKSHSHHSPLHEVEEVVVKAHPLHEKGLSQSIEVLSGTELADALQSNLGATLAQQPGIRASSFGAAVGRPVIRGLGGPRVKTTEDTIDSLDVSVTSTDHAVTVEPFIAEQITVLKGASTLLYGAGAIGGVVDIETGRIPTKAYEKDISGRAELRAGNNQNAQTAAARIDGNLGNAFAWHIDAFTKEADDYEIPGFTESARFHAAEVAEDGEAEEVHEGEEAFGVLEGSRYDIHGGASGLSWVGERGHLGFSISTIDARYGLVGGHGHEEHDEGIEGEAEEAHEEGVGMIELEQTRVDFSAELLSPFSGIESLSVRIGANDYQHVELEGDGEVGTVFENDAWEARIQAKHAVIGGFSGVLGLQLGDREYSANSGSALSEIDSEVFVPPTASKMTGVYWVAEREFSAFSLEMGARSEAVDIESTDGSGADRRDFNTKSASVGFIIPQSEAISWAVLFDYSERAPSIEELFSDGAHLASGTFERGDSLLREESAFSTSISLAYETDVLDAHLSIYHNAFNDFIYQASIGEEEDGLPVFDYLQDDAEFTGLDLEIGIHLFSVSGGDLDIRATYDTVSAEIVSDGGQDLPRIPADRFSTALVWESNVWRGKVTFSDVSTQHDVAPFELATDGYQDISAKLARTFEIGESTLNVFLQGRNLTDEEQREHVSFVKDLAPAPGRSLEIGLQVRF